MLILKLGESLDSTSGKIRIGSRQHAEEAFHPEEIISKLRGAEQQLSQGQPRCMGCGLKISEQTCYR